MSVGPCRRENIAWSAEADALVRRLWPSPIAIADIARALAPVVGRVISVSTVRARSRALGLAPRRQRRASGSVVVAPSPAPREEVEPARGVSLAPVAGVAPVPSWGAVVPLPGTPRVCDVL